MFTGIVAAKGEVVKVEGGTDDRRLWIHSPVLGAREPGASVAVDGVCLTVTERDGDVCAFDVSVESLARSTLGARTAGDEVNLELPLRATDELGGHIVQGHVDCVGVVRASSEDGAGRRVRIGLPPAWTRYVVEKGSVTVDGVSLTVTTLEADELEVALVPHTLAVTTLGDAVPGREVNIEVDVFGKYVERLAGPGGSTAEATDPETSGYL